MLTVIVGPMFAGKTTAILEVKSQTPHAILFKPKIDTRYSVENVVSHDGLSSPAVVVDIWEDPGCDVYIFDEIQFFDTSIIEVIHELVCNGKDVVVGGLNMDWTGRPFPVTAAMMAMADSLILLHGTCSQCGAQSTRTYKTTPDNKTVDLGGADLYESRCITHWRETCQNLKPK